MQTILLATTNEGKVREMSTLLMDWGVACKSLAGRTDIPEVNETGTTFQENALIKAKTISELTGDITLGDDSGLVVEALQGRPGVFSARYGTNDEERMSKLLTELTLVKDWEKRKAWFVCAVVIYDPKTKSVILAEGKVEGRINLEPKGAQGFGYDPIFWSVELKKTLAEATMEEKNSVSHRYRALNELKKKWQEFKTKN